MTLLAHTTPYEDQFAANIGALQGQLSAYFEELVMVLAGDLGHRQKELEGNERDVMNSLAKAVRSYSQDTYPLIKELMVKIIYWMTFYDQPLDTFMEDAEMIAGAVAGCLESAKNVISKHKSTLELMGIVGTKVDKLLVEYKDNAEGSRNAGTQARIGADVANVVSAIATPIHPPVAMTVAALAGGARFFSQYLIKNADLYTTYGRRMHKIRELNDGLIDTIEGIYNSLSNMESEVKGLELRTRGAMRAESSMKKHHGAMKDNAASISASCKAVMAGELPLCLTVSRLIANCKP
ncbi:hypothetical protein EDD21DRAFT_390508 [Dissophora ornata]|nr:hypothetical protein EDD21DRAFT_390508 [Dissophora ornata]